MKKIIALLMSLILTASLLAGCGSKEETENASGLSGELNLYTWDGMFPQEVLRGFEDETGVRINYSNFDYNEDMLAKLGETEGGDYDLVIGDDYILEMVISEGLAQKLDTAKLENYENLNPVFMSQFYDPENEYTVPYGAGIPLPQLRPRHRTAYFCP